MLAEFDRFAEEYEKVHNNALPPGVVSRDFVLQKYEAVQEWVRRRCQSATGVTVLDYGCGTGRLLARIAASPWCRFVMGVDESATSLEIARQVVAATGKPYWLGRSIEESDCSESCHLVLMSNVLHHIPPARRQEAMCRATSVLRRDGILALWEHNPWNPVTRLLVSLCPLDVHAHLISMKSVLRLGEGVGLKLKDSRYVNLLPPNLARFAVVRLLESAFSRMPVGTQYWVLFGK